MASIQGWIETHLRLQVNATKSGVGRVWERKFLGFRLNRAMQIEAAPESLERFKAKVREKWRSCQGGGTTDWPRTAARSIGWSPGFADMSGNAFGCGGTHRTGENGGCAAWDCGDAC
jgi:hypothetical protein